MTGSTLTEISDRSRLPIAPRVSVLMVTYNHEAWVGTAIESILAQEFDGGFELVIGEDCSSDATRSIVLDYQKRFPHLIRVLVSDKNVGPAANHARVVDAARGEFLAFCEGDDYWCHNGKLAAQASILQKDSAVAMVHSDWVRSSRNSAGCWLTNPARSVHRRMSLRYLEGDLFKIFYSGRILRTCTLMLRASALQSYKADPISVPDYRFEDTVISAYLASRWQVAYWPEVAAVYRESPGSLLRSGVDCRIRFLRSSLKFDSDARAYFANRNDYPIAYRWELSVGLLAWAIRGGDWGAVRFALSDIRKHFGLLDFVIAGWRSLLPRLPVWHRGRRARAEGGC